MDDDGKKIVPDYVKTLSYGRASGGFRRFLTGEKVSNVLRRLAWVAPLTLLIWIYAERQQERRQTVKFPVELVLNAPDRVIVGSADRFITAELKGPAAQLETVRNRLLQSLERPAVSIPIDQGSPLGEQAIRTALVGADPLFRTHAITVDNTEPQALNVVVDQVIERDVQVRVGPSVSGLLDGTPVFEPQRVRVRGPRSELERMAAEGVLQVFADLTGRESLRVPGVHEERAVPLMAPRAEHVTVTPSKVNVTVKVRPADINISWAFMPVWVNTPPGFGEKYRIVLTNQTLKDVKLTGPAEVMNAMQQESFRPKPKARLDVSTADLPAGETRVKTVVFDDLPRGVSVAQEDAGRTVEFRIVDVTKE